MKTAVSTIEQIAVMQAFAEGKPIQVYDPATNSWSDTKAPLWDWSRKNYRVRPTPLRLYANLRKGGEIRVFTSRSEALTVGKTDARAIRTAVPLQEVDE